ncbi:gamma carbonic anhydrase family protein [Desulforhabdus amnigena]|uniref:Gamma carbonic anhydrase family protein n=1 Tax=Desulforhabdus amnigena TaxID=40218 RepID=A0A9W6FU88_9BACT|nr:gamma carbonic anhydrase family protein [Desulforhabdus amnigena]NLJ27444.1 gamma carbonic anhydrase family protein [Deltaproteobacteria bacterium]GLI34969.1 gamma carbonic anhydrase family protein [Desulforhabdus amnigena]
MTSVLPYKGILPTIGEGVFIAPGAWVIGDVVIGERSSIWFNTVVRGDVHYIRLGSETNIQDNCTLHVTGGKFPLEVGNRVTVGHGVILHGSVVDDDCLIGMGAIILDGCKIGKGCIIAAGSVLPPGFVAPPESIIMGSPAQVKKKVSEAQRELHRGSVLHYLELTQDYLNPKNPDEHTRIKGFLG